MFENSTQQRSIFKLTGDLICQSNRTFFKMVSFLILLRSLRVNILKKLFLSISVNSAALGIFTSRPVAGGGAGGARAPQKFSDLN